MFRLNNNRSDRLKTRAYGNNEKRVVVTILFFIGLFSTLLLLIPSAAKAQNHPEESKNRKEKITFRVVSWNVENLFDCRHDTLKNDYEFMPDAMRHWNYSKYKQKLAHISRVIAAVGEWNPPALIGLCEVENDSVLNDLTRRSPLKELDYRYIITRSPDPRGIDVALLYQRDVFKLLSFRPVGIPPIQGHHPTCFMSAASCSRAIHSMCLSATCPAVRVEPRPPNPIAFRQHGYFDNRQTASCIHGCILN